MFVKYGDNFLLMAGGKNGSEINFWNFKNGECIRTFQNEKRRNLHNDKRVI